MSTFNELLRARGVTKMQLSRELGLGTTTIWRAAVGRKVDAESARKLCQRFPELRFAALTLGDPDVADLSARPSAPSPTADQ